MKSIYLCRLGGNEHWTAFMSANLASAKRIVGRTYARTPRLAIEIAVPRFSDGGIDILSVRPKGEDRWVDKIQRAS